MARRPTNRQIRGDASAVISYLRRFDAELESTSGTAMLAVRCDPDQQPMPPFIHRFDELYLAVSGARNVLVGGAREEIS
jgi:hypothetical protein